jgi:Porin PorA
VRRSGVAGLVLCGLGAALIALAPLLHFWVGPSLIKAPLGGDVVSDSVGDNVVYFDFASQSQKNGTVRNRDVYHGVEDDSDGDTAVYTLTSETYPGPEPDLGTDINASQERFAVDRKTGAAVPDPRNKERVDDDVDNPNAKHSGNINKLPFNTEKKSYPFWDSHIRSSQYPMEYRGEETVAGLKTYRFEQSVPDTPLPAVQPETHYVSHKTIWVEPETGVIVKGQQQLNITTGGVSDTQRLTILDGTFTFTEQNIADSAKRAKDGRHSIGLVKVTVPIICLVLGIILLVAGLFLQRRTDPPTADVARGRHTIPDDETARIR